MNKLQQLKQIMKSPPPERLAKIEYQSHFLQIIGITFVCIMLIAKGLWYIIFAFIFGLGVSYSQGITAYQKYKTIMSLIAPEKIQDYDNEKSPTRRRSKIIESVIPLGFWLSTCISTIITILIIDPTLNRWILSLVYILTIFLIHIIIYYFIMYWISYSIYKRRIRI